MSKNKLFTRRDFIKTSGMALLIAGCDKSTTEPDSNGPGIPIVDPGQINPEVDNLRVVCRHDPLMITGNPGSSFQSQNNAIDTAVVEANMDEMAKSLTEKSSAEVAWGTIFRKPDTKSWDQVKCAIKVNCIYVGIMPRISIVGKVCKELIKLGVTAENIVIYDGCHNASGKYTQYVGTAVPTGVKVSNGNSALNGMTSVQINSDFGSRPCTADIANGVVDILINCAVNKGHGSNAGSVTLCMKNHYGTFQPSCNFTSGSDRFPYIIAINGHDAIIGGNPARQQLCILDSLWAAVSGPTSPATHSPARIVMGTFAPAVDYLTVMKIRQDVMGVTPNSRIKEFLTAFEYSDTEIDELDFVYI